MFLFQLLSVLLMSEHYILHIFSWYSFFMRLPL